MGRLRVSWDVAGASAGENLDTAAAELLFLGGLGRNTAETTGRRGPPDWGLEGSDANTITHEARGFGGLFFETTIQN